MDLQDKSVIVTGGSRGIGKAIVSRLTGAGALVGVFDIDVTSCDDHWAGEARVRCLECDVTNPAMVQSAVDQFYSDFGKIDILINNAGILFSAPLVSFTPKGVVKHDVKMWKHVISTDLSSVFYMTVSVVEKMILKRTKGVIVNISSISAAGNAGQSAYSAAKAGVDALTTTWAKELGLLGIRVVGIAPGFIDTDSTHQALDAKVLQSTIKKVPLKRLGRVEDVAQSVLLAVQNDYMSGAIIRIDGGLTI